MDTWGPLDPLPVHENQVSVPSDMIEVGDSTYTPIANANALLTLPRTTIVAGIASLTKWQCYFHVYGRDLQEEALRLIKKRHVGRYNLAFCDGHIERIEHKRLYDRSAISLRRWNRDHEPHSDEPQP